MVRLAGVLNINIIVQNVGRCTVSVAIINTFTCPLICVADEELQQEQATKSKTRLKGGKRPTTLPVLEDSADDNEAETNSLVNDHPGECPASGTPVTNFSTEGPNENTLAIIRKQGAVSCFL
jgi:hypothetical protein